MVCENWSLTYLTPSGNNCTHFKLRRMDLIFKWSPQSCTEWKPHEKSDECWCAAYHVGYPTNLTHPEYCLFLRKEVQAVGKLVSAGADIVKEICLQASPRLSYRRCCSIDARRAFPSQRKQIKFINSNSILKEIYIHMHTIFRTMAWERK
jgi:hypothetical protein